MNAKKIKNTHVGRGGEARRSLYLFYTILQYLYNMPLSHLVGSEEKNGNEDKV